MICRVRVYCAVLCCAVHRPDIERLAGLTTPAALKHKSKLLLTCGLYSKDGGCAELKRFADEYVAGNGAGAGAGDGGASAASASAAASSTAAPIAVDLQFAALPMPPLLPLPPLPPLPALPAGRGRGRGKAEEDNGDGAGDKSEALGPLMPLPLGPGVDLLETESDFRLPYEVVYEMR
jgi:hypothetical protein